MNIVVGADPEEVGELAAGLVASVIAADPSAVLGVATGSTPQPLYRALARLRLDLSRASAFALDEYVGVPAGHPESYRSVLEREVVAPLGLDPARLHVPDGAAADPHAAARAHEEALAAVGGAAVQILGIGSNGHIGFNEPGSPRDSRTRVVALAERTRLDNRRFFGGDLDAVPTHAISQGVATILSARELLLVATGAGKAEAVAAALQGPIDERMPASFVREHPRVTVLLDRAAAAGLGHDLLLAGARR
ncbi:glucosamine-6-phosphate deaminase [Rathayibacter caricis]|uniref:glucosamine-6-phosphate deaminase n=1 Tax=Rathayibacter caricis TaxID=110936 RepID=UPI001FB4EBAC|nr:glucosamine-6-phosphate deaminase [Rathayibacter caricis]MCJ1696966.1 glucosamine-6-phosphate deaminase [Rathayibacter caricis]